LSSFVSDRILGMDLPGLESVSALSALDDPVRRRLYAFVSEQGGPVGRDEAARAAGIARPLAAYHLDKLAEEGLLTVDYRRPEGRGGPGAGRPAKRYTRSDRELSASVPPRDYGLAARLLADAAAADATGATTQALCEAAGRLGGELAAEVGDPPPPLGDLLHSRGYEPATDADGVVRLRNCPFHAAARRHPEVVCAMNLALLRGLLDGLGAPGTDAALEPAPGRCCVALRPAPDPAG
jgi:predicted ArsR family transcriptional regulator